MRNPDPAAELSFETSLHVSFQQTVLNTRPCLGLCRHPGQDTDYDSYQSSDQVSSIPMRTCSLDSNMIFRRHRRPEVSNGDFPLVVQSRAIRKSSVASEYQ